MTDNDNRSFLESVFDFDFFQILFTAQLNNYLLYLSEIFNKNTFKASKFVRMNLINCGKIQSREFSIIFEDFFRTKHTSRAKTTLILTFLSSIIVPNPICFISISRERKNLIFLKSN